MSLSLSWRKRLSTVGLYVAFAAIIVFFLFPIFWVLSLSLKSVPELFATPPLWFPPDPHFENYRYVFTNTSIVRYLLNSLFFVVATVICALAVAVCAAYGLSRFRFRYKRSALWAILVFQMISPVVIAIPLYQFFAQLGLLNNYASLIVVYVAITLPFTTWFLKGYLDGIPYDLDEAAIVDGCTRGQTLWKVLLPVSAPGIASAAILVAVLTWSQFVVPFILVDDHNLYPISVGLVNLKSNAESITLHYLAAASIVAIAPVMVIFALLQRYIVGALTSGAVKG